MGSIRDIHHESDKRLAKAQVAFWAAFHSTFYRGYPEIMAAGADENNQSMESLPDRIVAFFPMGNRCGR
jgi:hypothetical protein